MATVTKRGDSYRIKVSCGYDVNGKQVVQTRTWRPDPDMSARQIKKELDRQCIMFEEECKKGQVVATIKFETFAELILSISLYTFTSKILRSSVLE